MSDPANTAQLVAELENAIAVWLAKVSKQHASSVQSFAQPLPSQDEASLGCHTLLLLANLSVALTCLRDHCEQIPSHATVDNDRLGCWLRGGRCQRAATPMLPRKLLQKRRVRPLTQPSLEPSLTNSHVSKVTTAPSQWPAKFKSCSTRSSAKIGSWRTSTACWRAGVIDWHSFEMPRHVLPDLHITEDLPIEIGLATHAPLCCVTFVMQ